MTLQLNYAMMEVELEKITNISYLTLMLNNVNLDKKMSIHESLIKFGLDAPSSEIYSLLINQGELSVSDIIRGTEFSRTTIHGSLNLLIDKDLIEYKKEGRNAFYNAKDPSKLNSLLEDQKLEFNKLTDEYKNVINSLAGTFNITNKKPGIKFYEGLDELAELFETKYKTKETIYTYVNRDSLLLTNKKILEQHIKAIEKYDVKEKIIAADTPSSRKIKEIVKNDKNTEIKILPKDKSPFQAGMDMYDGKIEYATYKQNQNIMIVIEDPEVCKMHRQIFETLWRLI